MTTHHQRRARIILAAALTSLTLAACGADADGGVAAASASQIDTSTVKTKDGAVRGAAVPGGYAFLGLPYAAPPTGRLRWRAPERADRWRGVRDATAFGPSCPQPETPFAPPS